jgi:hypothetical protein
MTFNKHLSPALRHALERLAVLLRTVPTSSGIVGHFETRDLIQQIGGEMAISYGVLLATPLHHRQLRRSRMDSLASWADFHARGWENNQK